jgi:hypothetical protein
MIRSTNVNIKKFIERSDERIISLFNSFNLPERIEGIEDIKEKIFDNAINNIIDESITVLFDRGDGIKAQLNDSS